MPFSLAQAFTPAETNAHLPSAPLGAKTAFSSIFSTAAVPFSLSRLVKVTKTGQVVYKAEKDACRAFPDPRGDGLAIGIKRNFQVLSPLDFLAEFTQHIPPKGTHLIRYYGWYSNKARGMHRKAAEAEAAAATDATSPRPLGEGGHRDAALVGERAARCSQTWAMLIKRVYEIDPLACPKCGSQMKVIAFIEPPQGALIEKILRHCGLWNPSTPRAPPAYGDCSDFPGEAAENGTAPFIADDGNTSDDWTYVDIDTFEATF